MAQVELTDQQIESEECTIRPSNYKELPQETPPVIGSDSASVPKNDHNPELISEDSAPDKFELPEYVKKNFVEVEGNFYFHNQEPAFSYKNEQLKTKSSSPEVVKAFVEITRANDWKSITVTGNKAFRSAIWREATLQGIEVKGYTPTEIERAQVNQLLEQRKENENTVTQDKDRQVEADKGSDSPSKNEAAKAFLEKNKAEAVAEFPELSRAYATLSAAEKFAAKTLDPEQAKLFLGKVKEAYAEKLAKGEPLPAPTAKPSALKTLLARFKGTEKTEQQPQEQIKQDHLPQATQKNDNGHERASEVSKQLGSEEQAKHKFVFIMEKSGIETAKAVKIYEARIAQQEQSPESYAAELKELKEVAAKSRSEGLSSAEADKRVAQKLELQYDKRIERTKELGKQISQQNQQKPQSDHRERSIQQTQNRSRSREVGPTR